MKKAIAAAVLACLGGCATITPDAQKVVVYSQMSTLLKDCTKLGNVTSEASLMTMATVDAGIQQAKNNLRDAAAKQYKADSVVILNMDKYITSISMQGVAFKCN